MTTYTGTQPVTAGYYFNARGWKLETVEGTGVLPGDATVTYVRVPALAMLVLAPTMGFAFVVLLPFLGLAVLIEQGWGKAVPYLRPRRSEPATTTAKVVAGPRQ